MIQDIISVIIPVYNTGKCGYLERCLDSILSNSYTNLEVICINDGSTDNSIDILRNYEIKDKRVVVIDQENGGVSKARNAGIDVAKGNYIAFIDSDDWIHRDYFLRLITAAKKDNADLVICDYLEVENYVDDHKIKDVKSEVLLGADFFGLRLKAWVRGFIWGRIYSRSILGNQKFSKDFSVMEDNLFNVEVVAAHTDSTIVYLQEKMYYRFNRPGSLSQSLDSNEWVELSKKFIKRTLDISKSMESYSKISLLHESFKKALRLRYHVMYHPKSFKDDARDIISACAHELLSISEVSKKQKAYYFLLWKIPAIYRWYLISTDKSFLEAEKIRKNRKY